MAETVHEMHDTSPRIKPIQTSGLDVNTLRWFYNILRTDGVQFYQELVGILQWVVEIGRVGILLETSLLFSHLIYFPRIISLSHVRVVLKDVPEA